LPRSRARQRGHLRHHRQDDLPELKSAATRRDGRGHAGRRGTLGLLIPPSIIMIVYGVAADVSIAKLFMAGVLPGLMLAGLFSGYIAIWALPSRPGAPVGHVHDLHAEAL
jgi:C4-dicarboxylate transporter DctM subunit